MDERNEDYDIYGSFACVYDKFMDNVPYKEWGKYLKSLLEEQGISDGLMLELGCGTGSLTEILADAGYDMIGVDLSADMLDIAMEKREQSGNNILYLLQDMREFELYGTVRAVVSICDSMNYLPCEEDFLQTLKLVNNYLDPEGVFIFDLNTPYKYRELIGDATIAENREDASFIWENTWYEKEQVNEYDLTIFARTNGEYYQKFFETHYQKAYELETVKELIQKSGMEFVAAYDAFTREPVRADSERIYIIAREKERNQADMTDYIVRATAANSQIRAFAATTREMTEYARKVHEESPVACAALGRLMTAGAMMGAMMKGDKDLLTLQIRADGPLRGMTVTADAKGNVKGFAGNPQVMLPPNALGKLDVGGAVGHGILNVIKDMGMKEPYVGQVGLQTGEIAEDLTYYFATSEQVASSVGLGVLMNHDNTVRQAGGFIIQLMPFTDEKVIDALEKKLSSVKSVTSMLDAGMTPEDILQELLGEFGVEITEKTETRFACNCSKERMEKALISIGRKDLEEMIKDGEPIEMNCHFCNSHYQFSVEELKKILAQAKKR